MKVLIEIESDSFKDSKGELFYFLNKLNQPRIPKCMSCGEKIRFNDFKQIVKVKQDEDEL